MTNIYIESFLLQKYLTLDLRQKAGKWFKKSFNRHFIHSSSNLREIGKVKLLTPSHTAGRYEVPPPHCYVPWMYWKASHVCLDHPLPTSPQPVASGLITPCPEATVGAIASMRRPKSKSCSGVYHILYSGQLSSSLNSPLQPQPHLQALNVPSPGLPSSPRWNLSTRPLSLSPTLCSPGWKSACSK